MALLFKSETDRADLWRSAFAKADPKLDFRQWPDVGDPGDIDFALVWHPIKGDLKRYPNLKAIFSLGAGIEHIFAVMHHSPYDSGNHGENITAQAQ